MGYSKSSSKRDFYSNTILPQETGKHGIDNLTLPKTTGKRTTITTTNPKLGEGKKSL